MVRLVMETTRCVVALACSVGVLFAAAPALAQDKIVIKFGWSSTDGPQDPYAVGARAFKQRVEPASGGRLDVQLYPNRQIGDEKPLVEGMRLGTVDAGIITNAVLAQIEPTLQLNDLPFMFANEDQARAHLDGPVGQKLAANLGETGREAAGLDGGRLPQHDQQRPSRGESLTTFLA